MAGVQADEGSLPATMHVRWSVAIDPAVGEPFLSSWKSHLLWWFGGTLRFLPLFLLASLLHPPLLVVGLHVPSARRSKQACSRKCPRTDGGCVPGSSLLYGVAKLKAARVGAPGGSVEAMEYSSSIASTSMVCTDSGGLPSPSAASVVLSGRALLGPPT